MRRFFLTFVSAFILISSVLADSPKGGAPPFEASASDKVSRKGAATLTKRVERQGQPVHDPGIKVIAEATVWRYVVERGYEGDEVVEHRYLDRKTTGKAYGQTLEEVDALLSDELGYNEVPDDGKKYQLFMWLVFWYAPH